jgi:hypothetical protein
VNEKYYKVIRKAKPNKCTRIITRCRNIRRGKGGNKSEKEQI